MALASRRPGEFELIARYFRPLAAARGAFSLTDDAALVRPVAGEEIVITCDAIAEGVHFFADDPPDSIAQKALRVNLSDLAAKGATPLAYLMALALPHDWTEAWLQEFVAGLAADEKTYGIGLLGGDTIRASGGLTISITALGSVPNGRMVLRSGASPGDVILVSGTLGDAALGLRVRRGSVAVPDAADGEALLERYLRPEPRVALIPILRRYATSAIDISDGLIGDLGHICEVSGVGAEIDADAVPLSSAARSLLNQDPSLPLLALNGGDDYEILTTVSQANAAAFVDAADAAGVRMSRIGTIVAGHAPPVVRDGDGRPIAFTGRSHDHFSSDEPDRRD
jgi:thiamine-monophosphate kinase